MDSDKPSNSNPSSTLGKHLPNPNSPNSCPNLSSSPCQTLDKSKDCLTLGISFDLYGKFYLCNPTNNKYYQINVGYNDHPCADEIEYNIIREKENFNNFILLDDDSLKNSIRKKIKETMDDDCEIDEEDMMYQNYYDHYEEDFYCMDIEKPKEEAENPLFY